jgi:hypothetical protein
MKNIHLYLALIILIIIISCKKDKETNPECTKTFLIIGDTNKLDLKIWKIDTLIGNYYRCMPDAIYNIDIDSNGINDFKISFYYCYGGNFFLSERHIESLSDSAKILVYDTIDSPLILNATDTIDINDNFKSGIFFLNYWNNIDKKYIGLLLEDNTTIYYCWLKIGIVPKGYLDLPFIAIYEIAILKGCLPPQKHLPPAL